MGLVDGFNFATFGIAITNGVRNTVVLCGFLAPDVHRSYAGTDSRTTIALLREVTRKELTKYRHRRRGFRGYHLG